MQKRSWRVGIVVALASLLVGSTQGLSVAQHEAVAVHLAADRLRVEGRAEALGIDVALPRLSWQLVSDVRGVLQSAYQVRVASAPQVLAAGAGDVWDSGRVESDRSIHVGYGGPPLQPMTRYHWSVRVWDQTGTQSEWSAPAWFETGLLGSGWSANWIGVTRAGLTEPVDSRSLRSIPFFGPAACNAIPGLGPTRACNSVPVPQNAVYARKGFALSKPVARARIYATARGLYELHLNGERVGDAVFAPGWTDYEQRVQYQTYDVTELLESGDNAIGAVLTDGWYAGHVAHLPPRQYGEDPSLLLRMDVTYSDGTTQRIVSDASWRASAGPILSGDLLMGEVYDARAAMPGWASPGFDDSDWQTVTASQLDSVQIVAQVGPPVRRTQELAAVAVTEPSPGVFVFDMGQNMVGWTRLKVTGSAGTQVQLRHAEVLAPDGNIYTANLRSAKQTDTYVLAGLGEEVYEPSSTFHGFRYVEVTGYPGTPALGAITGVVVHSDTPMTGSFSTSDAMLNQLQSNITWSQRGNFLSIPTDCPQRDERMGWTGDAQIFARTAAFNADVSDFFTKWMTDVEDAQRDGGAFPDVVPDVCCGAGTAGWGDAGVVVPWTMYRVYGDTRIIEEHFDAMAAWIDYLEANSSGLLRPAAGYGDWLNTNDETPKDVIATAYFAHSTDLVARMARAIGRDADAAGYEQLLADIKAAFAAAYVTADGTVKGDTQTAYVLALHMDLLPDDLRDEAAAHLVRNIAERDWHLSTGFLGTRDLMAVLAEAGYLDVAYRLLGNDTFPSWGYPIVHGGATTMWERWDSLKPDGTYQSPEMTSFNHYAYGAVGEWMYRYIGGIDLAPDSPAYKHLVIRPRPGGDLTSARTSYDSVYGTIATEWSTAGNSFRLSVTVPPNTTATVYVPAADLASVNEGDVPVADAHGVRLIGADGDAAVLEVGSGTYEFTSTR